ncbi:MULTISPECIES: UDP-glucose 4-epimerase GalE [Mammaliicoccus]|uniref:UDP-glucose 4-epimerase GalE n=1 Tax=Mammaliicoccus TaxID=2803850 RepID=UPI0007D9A802|nr:MULTISPECIES: UDP-glucose 4-epimerase GalE [Mammaliicoccus]OAO18955.1 UDP-glucose 4-epimerase [Mammaliicoccus lentus]
MKVLVLGGAGYIGSHAVDQLIEEGFDVVVVDNLETGHKEAIHQKAKFYEGDCRNIAFMENVFKNEKVHAVMHFCAYSLVGESMKKPLKYFNNNMYGMQVLLETMKKYSIDKLIFSSTAAVYGEVEQVPIKEETILQPTNPYGESKLVMEKMVKWANKAYGLKYIALRYFNVAGAKAGATIGEDHNPETHLIPIILEVALGKRKEIAIYGNDYPTKDGTCIRDYLHVSDLVDAHIKALKYLNDGGESQSINLGSSKGYSVLEIIEAARKVTGHNIPCKVEQRRAGDPSILIASTKKAVEKLNFKPKYTDIEEIIKTAWAFHKKYPEGYNSINKDVI